ncbi:hypothetical protein KC353_g1312 [Hortaea werneckii]|nr:hypothetical protein KC353_g1312 [Hortaea werneckii]
MIALDFGTTKSAAAFRIAHCNGPPRRYEIIQIEQANREKTAPMIAAWLNDEFVCGHELQTLIDEGKVTEEKVMRFFKLLLYDDWQESEGAQHVARLLKEAGKSREDLFTAVLNRMYFYAQKHILKHAENKYDIDDKPQKVYLTVPKNASFSARQLLATSCERAGIPHSILVSEPLCAAAYNLQSLADDEMAAGLTGKHIIIVDGGGGTVEMRMVTALCGAEYVGDAFIEWFQERCPQVVSRGGIQGAAEYLFMSPTQLRAQARKGFEDVKRKFGPGSGDTLFFLNGRLADSPTVLAIALPWTAVQTFFEGAVQKVLHLIGLHFTDHTERIICTGGFGMSPYLQHRIKEAYPTLKMLQPHGPDCYFPVCKGALLRFDVIDTTKLRSLYAFGVTQEEEFDRERHPDGIVESTYMDVDGGRVEAGSTDLRVVKHAFFRPKNDVVEDRIQWLIKQDDTPGEDGWYISRPLWQLCYPRVDGLQAREFSATIVVTKRTSEQLRDSAPLIDKVTGQMFPDLEIQGKIEITLDAEQASRYKTLRRQVDGKRPRFYEVWSTIVLRHNKESLQAAVAFAAPEESPYDHDGRLKPNISIEAIRTSSVQWTFARNQTHEVWNHRYDPHVHDIIGSTVRQDDGGVPSRVQQPHQHHQQQHQPGQPPSHAAERVQQPAHPPAHPTSDPYRASSSSLTFLHPPSHQQQHVENRQHDPPPVVANPSSSRRRSSQRSGKAAVVDVNIGRSKRRTAKKSRPGWWR